MKINEEWIFHKEGEAAQQVTLPHDAMLCELRDANCRNGVNSGYFPGGKYIYEKHLTFTEEDLQKDIQLYFEGVYQQARIFCNGSLVGKHVYGFTPFRVDLTDAARAGDNLIRVTVDNSLEPNCRWYSGSGIYRSVHLMIRDRAYIKSVRVKTVSIDPPVVEVTAVQAESGQAAGRIDDITCHIEGPGVELLQRMTSVQAADGEEALLLQARIELPGAGLWSPEEPVLYKCTVDNGRDSMSVRFGIRDIFCSAATGFLLNGKETLLRGGCIHADHGLLGAASYRDAEFRRVKILKEAGYNAIRCAHNPACQDFLDACDELGMFVMDEAFDGWYIPKTYHDYSRSFTEHWREDLKSMVEVDYNHPSVILQSIGNEVSETAEEKGVITAGLMADYLRSLDGTRPVTAGINVLLNVYSQMGFGVYKEKGDYKAEQLPGGRHAYREKKTGSAFFNATAQKLGPLMFYMSKGAKGDRAVRAVAEKLDVIGLNYAASRYTEDCRKYPDRVMMGSETIIGELPYNWKIVKREKAVIGDFAWAAWDYLGEAGVGDYMYYSYEGLPLLAGSGAIDILGQPGPENYFQQIVWGLRKEPYLCVSPPNHSGETPKKSAWRFTDACASWNWPGYEGRKTVAEIYTDAPRAALYLNGRKIGEKAVKKYRCLFPVMYEPGELKAVAIYPDHRQETSLHTGKGAMSLRSEIVYQGEELTFLEITARDENGQVLHAVEDRILLLLEGGTQLLALGSARTKSKESYLANTTTLYRGRAMAILKVPQGAVHGAVLDSIKVVPMA